LDFIKGLSDEVMETTECQKILEFFHNMGLKNDKG